MSITWVLNGSSKYEISSKEHLLQLMTQGSLYTDAGSPPVDYWDSDYEQTVDIDLDHDANIAPIGLNTDNFTGNYDGGNFSISNWTFNESGVNVGLFGHTSGTITIENIKLKGIWVISNVSSSAGFLVGNCTSTTLRNIECTFDEGTTMSDTTVSYFGAVVGDTFFANAYAVTVQGFIDLASATSGHRGGVIARQRAGTYVGIRNSAVWTNGISGNRVGGITGELGGDTNFTYGVNAMIGDLTGTICGGLIGYNLRGGGADPFNSFINSMRGTITGSTYSGGIIGQVECDFGNMELFDTMNYMTGDIISTSNTSGGLVGQISRSGSTYCTISNSIVAMNGNSDESVIGAITFTPTVSTKIDASFGFTYTTSTYGSTSDTFTGTNSPLFTDLDYVPMSFTDDNAVSYEFEIVFGNVGGSASYSQYTHAIISKDDIAGPYFIDFDLTGNTTDYLTYISIGVSVEAFTDGSLVVLDSSADVVLDYAGTVTLFTKPIPVSFDLTPGAIDITVSIEAITGAEAYQLRYVPTSGGASVTSHISFTELTQTIFGLDPEVEYEVSLFFILSGESTYTLNGSLTTTTLANVSANYDVNAYGSNGNYDLSGIDDLTNISQVMDDIFDSGDKITLAIRGGIDTRFVKLGETLAIPDEAVLFPFDPSNGVGQQSTLTLENSTSSTIIYDETTDNINVGGTIYSVGDVFIFDGKKTTVFNV